MLFKLSLPTTLALATVALQGVQAACNFKPTTCHMSASITSTAAGTDLDGTRGLYLTSDLGDSIKYDYCDSCKSPTCEGCSHDLSLPGYSTGIVNCDDNLSATFTTDDNNAGFAMKKCHVDVAGSTAWSDGDFGTVPGATCSVEKDSEAFGFVNTVGTVCGCSFDCYKIIQQ